LLHRYLEHQQLLHPQRLELFHQHQKQRRYCRQLLRFSRKQPLYYRKQPLYYRKQPLYYRWQPLYCRKQPLYYRRQPLYCLLYCRQLLLLHMYPLRQ
jgi:hypothetical protein